MKAAPSDMFADRVGMMRTFANLGMVFSFSVGLMVLAAILSALSLLFNLPACGSPCSVPRV